MTEGEQPGGRVVNLHIDPALVSFLHQNAGVGVEPRFRAGAQKQRLVDAVFTLDGKGREGAKAQLGVEVFRLGVVMQHGQVEVAQATAHKVLDQVPYQHFTDTGP